MKYTEDQKNKMATFAVAHAKEIERIFGSIPGSYKNYLWSALAQLRGNPPVNNLDLLVQEKLKASK